MYKQHQATSNNLLVAIH